MANNRFLAEFLFPGAKSVTFSSDFGDYPLQPSDEERWQAQLSVPPGVHRYRYIVDGSWPFPDPFNARFQVDQRGRYFSVLDDEEPLLDHFPEKPMYLHLTDHIPTAPNDVVSPIDRFGPMQQQLESQVVV